MQGNVTIKAMWSKVKEVEARELKWQGEGKSGGISIKVMKAQKYNELRRISRGQTQPNLSKLSLQFLKSDFIFIAILGSRQN